MPFTNKIILQQVLEVKTIFSKEKEKYFPEYLFSQELGTFLYEVNVFFLFIVVTAKIQNHTSRRLFCGGSHRVFSIVNADRQSKFFFGVFLLDQGDLNSCRRLSTPIPLNISDKQALNTLLVGLSINWVGRCCFTTNQNVQQCILKCKT